MDGSVGETGHYVARWKAWEPGGALKDSRLVDELQTEHAVTYTVVLAPGRGCFDEALKQREHIASALGVASRRLVFERALWLDDAGRFHLTIVEDEIVATPRLAREPRVRDGVLQDVGRYVDGRGAPEVTMWSAERGRTVPVGLVGDPGSGRSNALRQLACGALSTGAMHLLLVDPSGIREPELREHGRVALVGEHAVGQVWDVLDAISSARRRVLQEQGRSRVVPSAASPGWMVAFADIGATFPENPTQRARAVEAMGRFLRDGDHLGLWPVAIADTADRTQWGTDVIRGRFAAQAFGFVPSRWSIADMGVDVVRAAVPPDVAGCAMASFGRANVSMRWDWQPGRDDVMPWQPWRDGDQWSEDEIAARDVIARYRQDAPVDAGEAEAITAVLGEPVAGRWVVTA